MDNFIEVEDVKSANLVSLEQYVFLPELSAARRAYVFKVRQAKNRDKN